MMGLRSVVVLIASLMAFVYMLLPYVRSFKAK
jgi:hypothetical protein